MSALIYPSILLGLSCVVVGIIVLRVVPEFSGFYQGMGAELPMATRVILAISDFLRQNLFLLGSALAVITLSVVAIKMIEVGESTGALREMLASTAEFFEEEIETSLSRFVTVVEPVLLVIMGLIIAILLLSLYMPLVQLGGVIS